MEIKVIIAILLALIVLAILLTLVVFAGGQFDNILEFIKNVVAGG